jgi:hypothetical protein
MATRLGNLIRKVTPMVKTLPGVGGMIGNIAAGIIAKKDAKGSMPPPPEVLRKVEISNPQIMQALEPAKESLFGWGKTDAEKDAEKVKKDASAQNEIIMTYIKLYGKWVLLGVGIILLIKYLPKMFNKQPIGGRR